MPVASSGCATKNLVARWRALVASWEASEPLLVRLSARSIPAISLSKAVLPTEMQALPLLLVIQHSKECFKPVQRLYTHGTAHREHS